MPRTSPSLDASLHQPPYRDSLPAALVFRTAQMPARASYPRHSHPWGEFVYAFSGVMEVRLAGRSYIAPPQYGIWLPPQVEHRGLNRRAALHSSLYIAPALCAALPREPCALATGPLARAMLDHLRAHPPSPRPTPPQQRLLEVLVDQLAQARGVGSYLPHSEDPLVAAVLHLLDDCPGDPRSLAELAAAVHTTERTLARRCQRELGMPLAQWRQRLRIVKALPRLDAGEKVEAVALDLGYASASAFIAMFRRMTGETPGGAVRQASHG